MCRTYNALFAAVKECREHSEKVIRKLPELERLSGLHFDRRKNIKHQLLHAVGLVSSRYNNTNAPCMTHLVYHVGFHRYLRREWYRDVVWLPFENVRVPAPIDYDAALTALFAADYMTPNCTPGHEYPFYQKQYNMLAEALVAGRMAESVTPDLF